MCPRSEKEATTTIARRSRREREEDEPAQPESGTKALFLSTKRFLDDPRRRRGSRRTRVAHYVMRRFIAFYPNGHNVFYESSGRHPQHSSIGEYRGGGGLVWWWQLLPYISRSAMAHSVDGYAKTASQSASE